MPGFGPRAVPTLIQSLLEPTLTDDERAITLASLGVLQARDAEALIASHLDHKNKHVRIQAAKALGNISAAQSTHALIASLEDSEWEVRVVSANALGKIADPAALRSLYQHLGDPVYWVRYNSGDALSKLGEAGIEQLTQGIECDDAFARDTCRLVLARTKRIPLSENGDRPC
jgi:HEAT repeat protein